VSHRKYTTPEAFCTERLAASIAWSIKRRRLEAAIRAGTPRSQHKANTGLLSSGSGPKGAEKSRARGET